MVRFVGGREEEVERGRFAFAFVMALAGGSGGALTVFCLELLVRLVFVMLEARLLVVFVGVDASVLASRSGAILNIYNTLRAARVGPGEVEVMLAPQ